MGMYSYKDVMYLIPKHISDKYGEDFLDPGYNGGLHDAAADYIIELKEKIEKLEASCKHNNGICKECGACLGCQHQKLRRQV
jgi:hypothetical protein